MTTKKKAPAKSKVANAKAPGSATTNGLLGQAFTGEGIGGGNAGFGFNQGSPFTQPVESTWPLYNNLRWYLISNNRQVLSQCYVELGLIQTICDVPVDDGLRGGIKIKSKELDEGQIEELQISIDRDDDLNTVGQACKWNRLYGGAGILILTDQDPEEPFDMESLGPDDRLEFRAVDMWELFWDKQNTEGYDPAIQTEDFEFYDYYATKVHKSRVMRLKGLTAPSFIRPRLRGWGFSVVEVLVRSINQYLKAINLGYEVLDEFKVDVYKVKNLVNTLMSPVGFQQISRRFQETNYLKNFQNAIVLDSEDDWDHKQLSFAGLAEAMAGIRMQVASDMRIPITKLFGQSASSGTLGNADQNDMENYNSMVESQVRNKLKYDILRICEIKCQKLFGFVPDDLTLEFKPLRELTAEQEENVKTQKFNRLIQAKTAGEISTLEFRDGINRGNLMDVTLDTSEDLLNPEDPEVTAIVKEGEQPNPSGPKESDDVEDPGANREDTRKPRAWDYSEEIKTPQPEGLKQNKKKKPRVWNQIQKLQRHLKNSAEFDKASYAADGGDEWMDSRRLPVLTEDEVKDKTLWVKAQDAAKAAGEEGNQLFLVWWYQKQGGKFL